MWPGGGTTSRVWWLGQPWVLVCAVVLVANDHVFKARWPGWWTGKLSDFAGVAVVGALLAVLLGRTAGVWSTALGFALLKTVPGVAEVAAPVLGGVTSRDATDLVGLVVLVAVHRALGQVDRVPSGTAAQLGESSVEVTRRGRAVASASLPVLTAVVALAGTTATSCAPDPAIVEVRSDGSTILARVSDNGLGASHGDHWVASDDDGRTWRRVEDPPGWVAVGAETQKMRAAGAPSIACGVERCVRARDRGMLESAQPGVWEWSTDRTLSDHEVEAVAGHCGGSRRGVLTSITALEPSPAGGDRFAASFGARGVFVWADGGPWVAATWPGAPSTNEADRGDVVAVVAGWGAAALLLSWLPPRRSPWQAWLRTAILLGGVVGAVMAVVAVSFGGWSARILVVAGGTGLAAGYVAVRIVEQTAAVERDDGLRPPW